MTRDWPSWWWWELELSPHLLRRMIDRRFTETDLRAMLEDATGYHPDIDPGRWVVEGWLRGAAWEVIVEPEGASRLLVVVPAYPVE